MNKNEQRNKNFKLDYSINTKLSIVRIHNVTKRELR